MKYLIHLHLSSNCFQHDLLLYNVLNYEKVLLESVNEAKNNVLQKFKLIEICILNEIKH